MTGLFEIDSEGFKSQQRGRAPYEVIREAIQNALDTDSDIEVTVDYDSSTVTVKDSYEDGVQDLDELWTLFEGDKRGDPEQRGRFGRGIKELIAASVTVYIRTTGGTVEFDVENDERTVDKSDKALEGTEVVAHNPEWENNQLTEVREFVERIWVPEGIEITVRSIRDGNEKEKIYTREEPDKTFDARLKTVQVNSGGVMEESYRDTQVSVVRDDYGGIYEMGIPVTTQEEFDFILDVHQKIPMAEQRDEPKSHYRGNLVQEFLENCLDLLDSNELSDDWVTENITSHSVNRSVKEEYISRRYPLSFYKGNVVATNSPLDDFVKQRAYRVLDVNRFSASYRRMLKNILPSSEDIYKKFEDEIVEEADPTDEQEEFVNFVKDNILVHFNDSVTIKVMELDHDTSVAAQARGNKISLNTANRDWTEINAENIGVILHELAHVKSESQEHDMEYIHDLQDIAGEILLRKSTSLL